MAALMPGYTRHGILGVLATLPRMLLLLPPWLAATVFVAALSISVASGAAALLGLQVSGWRVMCRLGQGPAGTCLAIFPVRGRNRQWCALLCMAALRGLQGSALQTCRSCETLSRQDPDGWVGWQPVRRSAHCRLCKDTVENMIGWVSGDHSGIATYCHLHHLIPDHGFPVFCAGAPARQGSKLSGLAAAPCGAPRPARALVGGRAPHLRQ